MPRDELQVTDLGTVPLAGGDGVVWTLDERHDLNANLVRLSPGGGVGEHGNDEVDVLVLVLAGSGEVTVDGQRVPLAADRVVAVPRGAVRAIDAGEEGLLYLTVHRQRGPLTIRPR